MKLVIVGGVAGGASAAARARRLSESAEIVVFERGPDASFANCGLPYYIGGEIRERDKLLVTKPSVLKDRYQLDVRTGTEVTAIDRGCEDHHRAAAVGRDGLPGSLRCLDSLAGSGATPSADSGNRPPGCVHAAQPRRRRSDQGRGGPGYHPRGHRRRRVHRPGACRELGPQRDRHDRGGTTRPGLAATRSRDDHSDRRGGAGQGSPAPARRVGRGVSHR